MKTLGNFRGTTGGLTLEPYNAWSNTHLASYLKNKVKIRQFGIVPVGNHINFHIRKSINNTSISLRHINV